MTLHELVVQAAARDPSQLALVGPSASIRYGELDHMANGLARRLIELGARHGDRVIVWNEKSIVTIAAMQAALRIGAAYIPVDGVTPPDRLVAMMHDGAVQVICTTRAGIAQLAQRSLPYVKFLDLTAPLQPQAARVAVSVSPDDLAYILYTSGSTGTPKGVCVSHRSARAFVDWAVGVLEAVPSDRFANHASLTFDLSVLDLYGAFAAGATACLIPRELSYTPAQLTEFLYHHRISIWYSVPSVLMLMMHDGGLLDRPAPTGLRAVLFAGEPFPIGHVRDLRSWTKARLFNLYGPTETNVCTGHEVVPGDLLRERPVPIGTATCGDMVWAEKPDGTVAGVGEEGELLVTGPTVMRGYWGHEPHRGPYRTGDFARVLNDGSFDYIGRRDHLVKIRGHRVELGEIEATLAAHPDVAEAAVVLSGTGLGARLVAFVVAGPGREPSALDLRRHSARRLPHYMIADEIRLLPCLPKTATGKTDRSALAASSPASAIAPPRRSA